MKRKVAILATAVIITATLVVGSTLAFFTDKGTVQNVITMGDVKISLTEPTFANTTNSSYKIENVMPNQKISKDPTITNTGSNDAYVRCKVAVTGDKLNSAQTADLLNGLNIGKDWAKSGEYYYYQKILPKKPVSGDSKVLLFDTVTIPENWDGSLGNVAFDISITAEAIQADNFKPSTTNGTINGWKYSNGSEIAPKN
jgi:predicted ribosomally synthesized peptide with SipW-like signal peptide